MEPDNQITLQILTPVILRPTKTAIIHSTLTRTHRQPFIRRRIIMVVITKCEVFHHGGGTSVNQWK